MSTQQELVRLSSQNSPLLKLESMLNQLNFFEVTGATRNELRHSNFIAFLFSEKASHNLGTKFFKLFCKYNEIELLHEPSLQVLREWHNIDLLIFDRANGILIVIENKVDTSEHSNQLPRYRAIVEKRYKSERKHFFYLTKHGEEASDDHYSSLSYEQMREILLELRQGLEENDFCIILSHYIQLIERHFMPNNDIAELCKRIYEEHKAAIDLVIEHKPNGADEVFDRIKTLIAQYPQLQMDYSLGTLLRFSVKDWDNIPGFDTSSWTKSGRLVLFEVNYNTTDDTVTLQLYMGPSDHPLRKQIYEGLKEYPKMFPRLRKLGEKWAKLYSTTLISKDDVERDNRLEILETNFERFMSYEFAEINEKIDITLK